jgi:glycolate oxidase
VERVGEIAREHDSHVVGCGHAGDGNVHMSVHQPDPDVRERVMGALLRAGWSSAAPSAASTASADTSDRGSRR